MTHCFSFKNIFKSKIYPRSLIRASKISCFFVYFLFFVLFFKTRARNGSGSRDRNRASGSKSVGRWGSNAVVGLENRILKQHSAVSFGGLFML